MLFMPVKMQEVDLVAEEGLRKAQEARKSVSEKTVVSFVRKKATGLINAWQSSRRGEGPVEEQVAAEKVLAMLVDQVVRLIMRVDRVQIELPLREAEHHPYGLQWMKKSAKVSQWKWVLDSGATNHMTSDRTLFQDLNPVQNPIHIANGATMMAEGEDDVVIGLVVNGVKNPVVLKRVMYVPEMGSSGLVSVRCIQAAGGVVSFAGNTISIKHGRELYGIAKLEQNAYILQTENIEAKPASAGIATKHGTLHDWHCRLGHISYDNVKRLAEDYPEITIDGSRTNPTFVSCVATKQTCTPNHFPSRRITTAPLELIHTDLAGPMKFPSIRGARYFLLFIDDHTKYTMVYTLYQKSITLSKFKEYKALVENYHNGKIKALRSDNGGEYTSKDLSKFLRESGISHETTAPY